LKTLRPTPEELVPLATEVFESSFLRESKEHAISLLLFVTSDRAKCVPLLQRAYQDADPELGEVASEVISRVADFRPSELLPVLSRYVERVPGPLQAMDDSLRLLGQYGVQASNAVPIIRKRFEKPGASGEKLFYAQMLMQIDPEDVVGFNYVMNLAESGDANDFSRAMFSLRELRTNQVKAATRLWNMYRALDPDSDKADVLIDVMVRCESPRTELIEVLRVRMNDTRQRDQQNKLNAAWHLLRLDPKAEDGWKTFKSFLFQEIENDPTNGNILRATTAMEYVLSLPVELSTKKALLQEAVAFYKAATPKEQHARDVALKHIIELDPSEPRDVGQLIRLYLD
jgi:hypothetical protein